MSPEQLAELDGMYKPFPSFKEWPREGVRDDAWSRRLAELERASETLSDDDYASARLVVVRAAAFDTGAIENLYPTTRGLTMTVAHQTVVWERDIETRGLDVEKLFNAQLRGYELSIDVATGRLPITEAWLRSLHEVLTEPQDTYTVHTPVGIQEHPLPRGKYKEHPNHVRLHDGSPHAYAPVDRTPDEMRRFVAETSSEQFNSAHPIQQAAYAHYALVCVHPFADGNGRVARALASVFLYRAARVPLLVFADQRPDYFDALEHADAGDARPFQTFVAGEAIGALELVAETLRSRNAPDLDELAEGFRELVTVQGGLTHVDLDAVAGEALSNFDVVLRDEVVKVGLPNGVSMGVGGGAGYSFTPPEGYRQNIARPGVFVRIDFASAPPAAASRTSDFVVSVSSDKAETVDVFLITEVQSGDSITLSLTDIKPRLTPFTDNRLRLFIKRILGRQLADLRDDARAELERQGYV